MARCSEEWLPLHPRPHHRSEGGEEMKQLVGGLLVMTGCVVSLFGAMFWICLCFFAWAPMDRTIEPIKHYRGRPMPEVIQELRNQIETPKTP